jgi:hypothetical protein
VIRFAVRNWSRDLRSRAQLVSGAALAQEMADLRLEREWRNRVAENVRNRVRLGRIALDGAGEGA